MPWWRGGDGKLGFGWRGEKVTSLKWKDGWNCYRGACGNRVLSIECRWQKQRCLQPSCHSGRDAPSDPLALVAFSVISTKRRVQKHNWLKTQGPSSILLDKPDRSSDLYLCWIRCLIHHDCILNFFLKLLIDNRNIPFEFLKCSLEMRAKICKIREKTKLVDEF